MTRPRKVLVVGAGLSGATIAERCAALGADVTVIEKRGHIGGNVYDAVDPMTGIRVSHYGAHLFHTNDEEVWEYIQRFGEWRRWDHKVIAQTGGIYVPVPVNPTTVNTLFGLNIQSEMEMQEWLSKEAVHTDSASPANSEEVALQRVGLRLYERLFRPYTIKQWAKEPRDLEASVLQRIPVRTTFDDRYFSDRFQGLPVEGYTQIVERMLESPRIQVRLGVAWEDVQHIRDEWDEIVYTGPIDQYFKSAGLPALEYRSIEFEWSRLACIGYAQPNSVVNYPDPETPYTRCVEYKHFLHQPSEWTILSKETTTDSGEPYYPVPTERNRALYERYKFLASKEKGVHFIGRLASYKYFNMDQAIRTALDYVETVLQPRITTSQLSM